MRGFHLQPGRAVSFFVDNWILLLVALASGAHAAVADGGRGGGALSVGTAEAVRLINREKGVLIDVSEPAEFAAGHAAGARNMPLGKLEGAKELPSNKALPLVLLCASRRARRPRRGAAAQGRATRRPSSLAGGMAAWREAGLPVDEVGLTSLPAWACSRGTIRASCLKMTA